MSACAGENCECQKKVLRGHMNAIIDNLEHELKSPMVVQKNPDGKWVPAQEEPYYPNLFEKIACFFGHHDWRAKMAYPWYECLKCRKLKRLAE